MTGDEAMNTSRTKQPTKILITAIMAILLCITAAPFALAAAAAVPKDAEPTTKQANTAVLQALNFADQEDFEEAQRGFIAAPADAVIKSSDGQEV
jgi:alkyl sulfatase BDS1-like metallo-beta-lactamase superfamily hydrolase